MYAVKITNKVGNVNMKKGIKCKHYEGDGFTYEISDEEELSLCSQCHMNLAGEIAKQVVITSLVPSIE